MWSWKLIYEDETFNLFCDIDNVIGSEEIDEDTFAGVECYRPLPDKIAVWVSIGIKDKGVLKKYAEQRKEAELSSKGYGNFSYTLGLVELDAVNRLYRFIPATDFNGKDTQLGTSSLLDSAKDPLLKGIKGDWSKIGSPKTSKAIKLLFNFFYRSPSQKSKEK